MIRKRGAADALATEVEWADSFLRRFVGLLGRAGLAPGAALVIEPCTSVHMFFMRFSIDVAFLAGDGEVLAVYHGLAPWRISGFHARAARAVELPAGALKAHGVAVGDVLELGRPPDA